MMNNRFDNPKKGENFKSKLSGFTLIELLITISIFVFMTALVMARYNDFYSGTLFKNLAYDIAITIREAQSYGISVKYNEGSNSFDRAYGAYFPQGAGGTNFSLRAYNKADGYILFEDPNQRNYTLKHGATFNRLLVSMTDGVNSYVDASNVAIIFQRPNPEAIICVTLNAIYNCNTYKFVKIEMKAANGVIKTVKVNSSGQIAIIEVED